MSKAHPYRVSHHPQVPGPAYVTPATDVREAVAIADSLAGQHLWLLERGIISDYSNAIYIEVWDGEEWEQIEDTNPVVQAAREERDELDKAVASHGS